MSPMKSCFISNKPQMHFFRQSNWLTIIARAVRNYNGVFQTHFGAGVAKLVDTVDSKINRLRVCGFRVGLRHQKSDAKRLFFYTEIYGL